MTLPFNDIRAGIGFDVHALEPGEGVWLCGVWVECPYHLIGHSDADVALHAVCDALFGAIGAGDIGQHFPPTDPQWKGKRSSHFVHHAVTLLKTQQAKILNVDVTIIGEKPKISPHRNLMQQTLAELLQIETSRVNIKATTTEKLGFLGRQEGLAAQAITNVLMLS